MSKEFSIITSLTYGLKDTQLLELLVKAKKVLSIISENILYFNEMFHIFLKYEKAQNFEKYSKLSAIMKPTPKYVKVAYA